MFFISLPHTHIAIILDPSMERNYEVHNLEIVVKTSLVSPNSICLYCVPWIPKNRYNVVLLVLCIFDVLHLVKTKYVSVNRSSWIWLMDLTYL